MPARPLRPRRWLVVSGLLWAATSLAPALAQSGDETAYSTDQLKAFVAAQADVADTLAEWKPRLAEARPDQRKRLVIKQERALVAAVEAHDLSPATYNTIAEQAQKDPVLTRRIQSHMTAKPAPAPEGDTSNKQ